MVSVDLNCDVGEGISNDAALMPYISSANIACGYHAGNEATMRTTIKLAVEHNVAIGAHPGFPDKPNFGRIALPFSAEEVYQIVAAQVSLINKICEEEGVLLHHVKPHGALYNLAAGNENMARAIAAAVHAINHGLILYGLSGSRLITEAAELGLKTASEVFADRTYQDDGRLTHRTKENALIKDKEASIKQVLQMVEQKTVTSVNGTIVPIVAETICIHGDAINAVEFARSINLTLKERNIPVKPI
jgi:UPF0271 protein